MKKQDKKTQMKLNSLEALKKYASDENVNNKKADGEMDKENIQNPKTVVDINMNSYYINQSSPVSNDREAKAPYNFIPLNEKIIISKINNSKISFDQYYEEAYAGYIKVNIVNRDTPLFIRDTYDQDQVNILFDLEKQIDKAKEEKNKSEIDRLENERLLKLWEFSDFYSPGGKLGIPGSTQRGLIKTMVEIISYGKFDNYENKRFYYRGLADMSNLRNEYQDYMVDRKDNYYPKINAGLLRKAGYHDYRIIPSKKDASGTQIYRINFNKATGQINTTTTSVMTLNDYDFKEVYFKQVAPTNNKHKRKRRKNGQIIIENYFLKYALVNSISNSMDATHTSKGYIISSGPFDNKHMHWIINEAETGQGINIDYQIVSEYANDTNRQGKNIIEYLEKNGGTIPCFYITDNNGKILSFGQSGMFRLAYNKTMEDHIPNEFHNVDIIDIPTAIFGNEKTIAGRVFFEDAFCEELEASKVTLGAKHPQILSSPKPTTFQHYLTQPDEKRDGLKHYNPDASNKLSTIRGYKLYWHKTGEGWKNPNQNLSDKEKKQYTKINPVKTGTTFTGRIRFENLSDVELGALLFALDLPNGCCHKIGMGKPLGLGSIRITPTLHLSTREKRYTSIASEWSFDLPESKDEGKDIEHFKNAFATYILNTLNGDTNKHTSDELWKVDRLNELKTMLDFDRKPYKDKTRYMKIQPPPNEFRERPVLPKPTDVK